MGTMRAANPRQLAASALHVKERYLNYLDNQRYALEQERDMLTFEGKHSKAANIELDIARVLQQRQRAEQQRRALAAKLGEQRGY